MFKATLKHTINFTIALLIHPLVATVYIAVVLVAIITVSRG